MASTDFLVRFFPSFKNTGLSRNECQLFEIVFFIHLYNELFCEFNKNQIENKEDSMISGSLIKGIIKDLLLNKDYSVEGLAAYTGYPADVIYDLVAGMNTNPTLVLAIKIVELHAMARREFYDNLIQKIFDKYRDKDG